MKSQLVDQAPAIALNQSYPIYALASEGTRSKPAPLKGHEFGLKLKRDEKKTLIAFLLSL
jgi:hypothetical protein